MYTCNRMLKYTVFGMQRIRDFEEHLDRVEEDKEEEKEQKDQDDELNLESNNPKVLRKKDDIDDEGKETTVENKNQTFEGPDGGQNKLSTSPKDKKKMTYSIRKR